MTNTPAVSVIIPMFNAAKYVGQCFESLLAQTFTDFEVIVVDDMSTDSSAAIVESYAPKFNGRLALLQLDRNTGSGAVPRNTGLKFARGEYVYFMDADDLLTLTALEELHALAESFGADVVYCESYYKASADLSKILIHGEQNCDLVTRPTFESDDLSQRTDAAAIHDFLDRSNRSRRQSAQRVHESPRILPPKSRPKLQHFGGFHPTAHQVGVL